MPENDPFQKHECIEALHEIYLYMDGQLTEERRTVIRQHLDDCPPCGGAFDFESELRMVISRRCRDTVPDELRQRIANALAEFGGTVDDPTS